MKDSDTTKKNKKHGKEVGSEDFNGEIHLKMESAENYDQVKQFCAYLQTIKTLKITSYNWSESKGLIITVSLQNALPLGNKLRKMPLVEQVYRKKKNITVVLNNPLPETPDQVLTPAKEAIPV